MVLWDFIHKCTHIYLLMYIEIYKYSYLYIYDKNSSLAVSKTAINCGNRHIKSLIVTFLVYVQCLHTFPTAAISCAISLQGFSLLQGAPGIYFSHFILLAYFFPVSHSTRIQTLSCSYHWGQQRTQFRGKQALLSFALSLCETTLVYHIFWDFHSFSIGIWDVSWYTYV